MDIEIESSNNKIKSYNNKSMKTQSASVDKCITRSHHAPLERQMCLQLPEERPFLRRYSQWSSVNYQSF